MWLTFLGSQFKKKLKLYKAETKTPLQDSKVIPKEIISLNLQKGKRSQLFNWTLSKIKDKAKKVGSDEGPRILVK